MDTKNTETQIDYSVIPPNPDQTLDLNTSRSLQWSTPSEHGKLGRELKFSPKTHVSIDNAPVGIRFNVPAVSVIVGIGNDHVAYLFMEKAAYEAFKAGEPVSIETVQEFKQRIG